MREHSARAVLLFTLILNVAMFVLLSFIDKFFSGLIQQPKAPAKNGKIFSIFPEEPSSTITYEEETSDLTIVAEHPNPLYTSKLTCFLLDLLDFLVFIRFLNMRSVPF